MAYHLGGLRTKFAVFILMGGLVTSLQAVASYWPPLIRPVSHYLRQQGLSGFRIKVYEKCFGFSEVREAWQTDPAQQLLCAVEQLEGLRGNEHRVRHVLQARAMPTATPRNPAGSVSHTGGPVVDRDVK